jgi:hypothetical protein
MSVNQRPKVAYGLSQPNFAASPLPILSTRNPLTSDFAEIGTTWINESANGAWILTSVTNNNASWFALGTTDYGAATNGQLLIGSTGAAPAWNTLTAGPDITITNTANHVSVGVTNGTNGQVLIGGGAAATWNTITAGSNISVTNAANGITIAATTGAVTAWSTVTANTALVAGHAYVNNKAASACTFTLPATALVGDTFQIVGYAANGWTIVENAAQQIAWNDLLTTATTGSLSSANRYDNIIFTCIVANTLFSATAWTGTLTVV